MSNYIYSALNNSFYPVELKENYANSDTGWPPDGINVSDETYRLFTGTPPAGMMRISGSDGYPMWVEVPEPSPEELIAIADAEKSRWLAVAKEKIELLSDAVELDIATDKELSQLKAWKVYRVLLMRIDTIMAPNIEWPTQPDT
ncbi:tail fiber assembly protein [Limnobaculum xujianqingii]|uniref:tail fiber assembly protein n=1 Tax=Limnobaculum xujianqingii TaxID=2738837 RepID=UPI00112B99F0|nr:tail fiber assembly protein [Limnobaculum xujianqingii]